VIGLCAQRFNAEKLKCLLQVPQTALGTTTQLEPQQRQKIQPKRSRAFWRLKSADFSANSWNAAVSNRAVAAFGVMCAALAVVVVPY
jgi:hypothetical protein